jgi:hypothetical protein
MPGENLHKFSKSELKQLRDIVRQVYAREEGMTIEQTKAFFTDYECDKLIDSLLPSTVETLKEMGEARGFLSKKRFFLPSKIVAQNGKPIFREDR